MTRGETFGLKSFKTSTVAEANDFPLLFEPGEGWEYSVGVDWAGEMVSRVNGNITLESYLQQYVWSSLGIKNLTFHSASNPAVLDKLVDMSQRDTGLTMFGTAEDPNVKVIYTEDTIWDLGTVHCQGGAGGYGLRLNCTKYFIRLPPTTGKYSSPLR